MEIIQSKWISIFFNELKDTKELRIISPFISDNMVNHLLKNWRGNKIQVITRYNLNDFRSGVSNLSALKKLIDNKVEIKGIKDLHSKAYIFDRKSMIITSANFTNGGFFNNYELGIKSENLGQIIETLAYFNKLWQLDSKALDIITVEEWETIIKNNKIVTKENNLKDYGISVIKRVIGSKNHFIKFYGRGHDRANLNTKVTDIIEGSHCHFAITFPKGVGKPKRYKDGDVVYLARMIDNNDYAIFGKAIAYKHNNVRDIASPEDIEKISWKSEFPIYIRVHSGEFLNTTLLNCPKMGKLMNELGYDCFRKTKERHDKGEVNINPRLSLKRKPDIWLSEEGAFWVEKKFEEAKNTYKLVNQSFIDSLYQGSIKI